VVGALTVVLGSVAPARGQEPPSAGRVKVVSGSAFVVRQGMQLPAHVGQVVLEADSLKTGADGRVGVTLNDETRVSLGPSSEMLVSRFTYSPAESSFALTLRFVRGIAAYVSGRIAKLSPDAIRLETPASIVGVRGTRLAIRVDAP
jgi:hypothetical protein